MILGAAGVPSGTRDDELGGSDDEDDGLIATGPQKQHGTHVGKEGFGGKLRCIKKYSRSLRSGMCVLGTCLLAYIAMSVHGLLAETQTARTKLEAQLQRYFSPTVYIYFCVIQAKAVRVLQFA